MAGLLDDVWELVKFVRIAGVGDFVKALVEECKDGPSRRKYKDFMVLPEEEMTLANRRKVACRALGLPDDWVYNEAELRKTRSDDPVVRCHAIDTLIWLCTNRAVMRNLEEEKLRGDQLKLSGSRKLLPGPQKLLPGAR
jgi:hypothetical protein